MIKAEVVFDGDEIHVNGYIIKQCIYNDMSCSWDVSTQMFGYECGKGSQEEAIKYCLEN